MHVLITPDPDDTLTDDEVDGVRSSLLAAVTGWTGNRCDSVTVEVGKAKRPKP